MPIHPPAPERANGADYSEVAGLQRTMEKILNDLDAAAPGYAKANMIHEFIGDRKKAALADAFTAIQNAEPELSATAAEHRARASTGYKTKIQELMRDELNAENARTLYHLLQTRLDVQRSWLACERAKIERHL